MEICRVLEKALKENKDERYETVDDMLKHVRQWRRLCKVDCLLRGGKILWHVLVFHSDGLGVSMQSFLFQCFSIQRREGSLEVYGWALGV